MVDNETTTKDGEESSESTADLESGLSLEDLDSLIAADDPEFAAGLSSIGPDDPNDVIYEEGIELEYRLESEIEYWRQDKGWRGKAVKALPFLPFLFYHFKMKRTIMRFAWQKWKAQTRNNLKALPQKIKGGIGSFLTGLKEKISEGLSAFKDYSLKRKLLFVALLSGTVAAGIILVKIGTKGLLPPEEDMFISSLADWSEGREIYDPALPQESFYESTRTSQNVLLMKKMVVNIRRSANSGVNPMAAFEFYVEGTVAEVLIEIKDREYEMEDLFLRTMEEMTYDQLSTGEGKRLLCDRLRRDVNKVLTRGLVRRIFIKTAILKP